MAINEDTVHDAYYEGRNLLQELVKATGIRVAIMSPQMLQSGAMNSLIDVSEFRALVRWFLIDEIHLADEESGDWKMAYLPLKYMRQRLRPSTIWAGFTGTATHSATARITSLLGFPHDYVCARYSVDRPHIKYIVRFHEFPVSGTQFFDLAFVIPLSASSPGDIPRTFIFCETIELGWRVMLFLDSLLPSTFPNRNKVVLMYNSLMPKSYRQQFMAEIIEGSSVRIGICTETCTYGLDAPNIRRSILFTMAPSHEALKQRISRGGRDGLPAEAYSFAPAWVREVLPETIKTAQAREDAQRRGKLPAVVRDWFNPSPSRCPRQVDLEYFGETMNSTEIPAVCCSFHHPQPEHEQHAVINRQRFLEFSKKSSQDTIPLPRSDGTYSPLETTMRHSLLGMLETWRRHTWLRIRGLRRDRLASQFLPTSTLSRIVDKAHLCTSLDHLQAVMQHWSGFDDHGEALFAFLTTVLEGFNQILKEREDTKECGSSNNDAWSSLRLRLVPSKRQRSDSDGNTTSNEKRTNRSTDI